MLNNLKEQYVKCIFTFIYGIIIIIINNLSYGMWDSIFVYINGLFVAGFSLLCFGGLSVCAYFGTFDIFTHLGAKRGPNGVKPTLYEHSEALKEKRSKKPLPFIPYFVIGAIYIIIMFILYMFL